MSNSSEQLASNLLELIKVNQIERICVYEKGTLHYFDIEADWHFGPKVIKLGQSFYNVVALLTYQVTGNQLSLYF